MICPNAPCSGWITLTKQKQHSSIAPPYYRPPKSLKQNKAKTSFKNCAIFSSYHQPVYFLVLLPFSPHSITSATVSCRVHLLLCFCYSFVFLSTLLFFTFTLSLTCWLLIKQDVHTNALLTFTMSYLLSRLFLTFTVEHNKTEEKKVYNKYISIIISTILNFRRNHNHKSNWIHWKIERKQREAVFPLFEIIFQRIFLFRGKKLFMRIKIEEKNFLFTEAGTVTMTSKEIFSKIFRQNTTFLLQKVLLRNITKQRITAKMEKQRNVLIDSSVHITI